MELIIKDNHWACLRTNKSMISLIWAIIVIKIILKWTIK